MRLMKVYCLVVLVCVAWNISAQLTLPSNYDTTAYKTVISLNGFADLGGTGLNNGVIRPLFRGGEIDSATIAQNSEKLGVVNRAGWYLEPQLAVGFSGIKWLDQKGLLAQVKVGMLQTGSTVYSQDAFNLAMRGNSYFLGDTANINGLRFTNWSMFKLGLGIQFAKEKHAFSLNYYGIQNYNALFLYNGELIADSSGQNQELYARGFANSAQQSGGLAGHGVGFDARFNVPVEYKDRVMMFSFEVQNLGFAVLNKVARASADTTISFSGFTVADLTNGTTFLQSDDVANELGISRDTAQAVRLLPFYFQVGKQIDRMNPNRLQSFYGFRILGQNATVPQPYGGVHARIFKGLESGLSANFGGFSGLRMGWYLQWYNENWHVGVGTDNVLGWLSKSGQGYALAAQLNVRL